MNTSVYRAIKTGVYGQEALDTLHLALDKASALTILGTWVDEENEVVMQFHTQEFGEPRTWDELKRVIIRRLRWCAKNFEKALGHCSCCERVSCIADMLEGVKTPAQMEEDHPVFYKRFCIANKLDPIAAESIKLLRQEKEKVRDEYQKKISAALQKLTQKRDKLLDELQAKIDALLKRG